MNIDNLRKDCSLQQKKGLHFILASIIIWIVVATIHSTSLPILTKNLFTFFATAPLMPIAFLFSKLLKIEFSDNTNPLNKLGLIFSINQVIYLLIAMWIFPTVPDKMVMVLVIIFGAHLFPYGWLYKSNAYFVMAVAIPILGLVIGLNFNPNFLAFIMVLVEMIFAGILILELRRLNLDKSK